MTLSDLSNSIEETLSDKQVDVLVDTLENNGGLYIKFTFVSPRQIVGGYRLFELCQTDDEFSVTMTNSYLGQPNASARGDPEEITRFLEEHIRIVPMSPAAYEICIFLRRKGIDIVGAETSQELEAEEDFCELDLVDTEWTSGYRFLEIRETFDRMRVTVQLIKPAPHAKSETTYGTLEHVKQFLEDRMVLAPTVPEHSEMPYRNISEIVSYLKNKGVSIRNERYDDHGNKYECQLNPFEWLKKFTSLDITRNAVTFQFHVQLHGTTLVTLTGPYVKEMEDRLGNRLRKRMMELPDIARNEVTDWFLVHGFRLEQSLGESFEIFAYLDGKKTFKLTINNPSFRERGVHWKYTGKTYGWMGFKKVFNTLRDFKAAFLAFVAEQEDTLPSGIPSGADVPHHLQSIMQLLDARVSTLETQLCE